MRVLMITGDRNVLREGTEAHARLGLQRSAVDHLAVVYMGRGSVWPRIPAGSFDVVTAQDPFWRGLYAWHSARRLGARLNIQVHTNFEAETRGKPIRRALGQFVLGRADSARVVTNAAAAAVKKYTRAPISVLPIFVDVDTIRAAASTEEFSRFSKIILAAARLEPEKNVIAAVDAMPDILKHVPNTGLLIAGRGSQENFLKQRVRDLGIQNNVVFLGYRNDMGKIYKSADVLLVTSLYESYGASIVEALAAGVPVVSGDVGIAKEAGAIVVPEKEWTRRVVECLINGTRGELQLETYAREEWKRLWRASLEGGDK